MKHGILSTAGNYIMEATGPESIPHYAAKVLCVGDGNERRPPGEAEQLADRIVLATNAYDALVAQRDALVEAGSLSNRVLKALKAYDRRNELGLSSYVMGEIGRAIEANEAALALAKEAQCTGS